MITKYTEFNIVCDECGIDGCGNAASEWHPWYQKFKSKGETGYFFRIPPSEKGVRDMRKIAKECDWVYRGGKDICPNCRLKGMSDGN